MKRFVILSLLVVLGLVPVLGRADKWSSIEDRVVEYQLENGMRFLILERHHAPLISMVMVVKVGSVNEVTNKTGIAHFLEHLAFKGNETVGTSNYKAERKALNELDAVFERYMTALDADEDSSVIHELENEIKKKQKKADSYMVKGEFDDIYSRNGSVGLNASTSYDITQYRISLPSNRFELWAAMESERMSNPVFREFYTERSVIMEERRMRTDNSTKGLFFEEQNSILYKAHPYGQPIIGHMSDIQRLRRADVREFYETYYVPQHMTAAIVGDVDPEEIKPIIDLYFSRIPSRPDPPKVRTIEPPQPGIRRLEMEINSYPYMVMEFHTVHSGHPDEPALYILASVLGDGRTSRLYRSLVEERQVASYVSSSHSSRMYAGTFWFSGSPKDGVTAREFEDIILAEIEKIEENPVTESEIKAALARREVKYYTYLSSNQGMAYSLAAGDQHLGGGWRENFDYMRSLRDVTPEDVMRVYHKYLIPEYRCVGIMEVKND